jgi:hypothetical protein
MKRESSEALLCRMKKADFGDSFIISNDLDHVAFVRGLPYLDPPRQILVADGKFSPVYDAVARGGIAWHPNGHKVAYAVFDQGAYHLAVWDMQGEPILWSNMGAVKGKPAFSPDGGSVGAIVRTSSDSRIIVNGNEIAEETLIFETPLFLTAEAKRVAYQTSEREGNFIVWGDERFGPYHSITSNFAVSPDGNHIAYEAFFISGEFSIILDGQIIETRQGDGFGESTLRFSPSSESLAYATAQGVTQVSVSSGKRSDGPAFVAILYPGPVFSPDSEHLVYGARDESGSFLIVDGARTSSFDRMGLGHFAFSPDSTKIAFSALMGDSFRLMLWGEGETQCLFEEFFVDGNVRWSPDGQLVACRITQKNRSYVRIGDSLGRGFDGFPSGGGVYFLDNRTAGYLAAAQNAIYRVRETLWEGENELAIPT